MSLLLTAGGEEEDNADMAIRAFQHLVEYTKGAYAGHLLVPHCFDPDNLGTAEKQRAAAWAQTIGRR
jgi:hypothetical protein